MNSSLHGLLSYFKSILKQVVRHGTIDRLNATSAYGMLMLFVLLSSCQTNGSKESNTQKSGILLVTFGSSYAKPHQTFQFIDSLTRNRFPNQEIRWAYTSSFVIKKLKEGKGHGSLKGQSIHVLSPREALLQMIQDGFSHISVQSLHMIPGSEYDDLAQTINKLSAENPQLKCALGVPLMNDEEDLKSISDELCRIFSGQLKRGEPVLFMGHGSEHASNIKYALLEKEMQKKAAHFYVGTVEGFPLIDDILPKIKTNHKGISNITITPLMSVVGDHALNDLNGTSNEMFPENPSWREKLEAEGYHVNSILKGMGDYPNIINIWLNHLEKIRIK